MEKFPPSKSYASDGKNELSSLFSIDIAGAHANTHTHIHIYMRTHSLRDWTAVNYVVAGFKYIHDVFSFELVI